MDINVLKTLAVEGKARILLIVLDGLGGLPGPKGRTELETASIPNLDALASESMTGLHIPIDHGITPGSGPAHMALFGYNPLEYDFGRGLLAALGIGFPIQPGDVAARINFATRDEKGAIVDRRAGRISTEICTELCGILNRIEHPDARIFFRPVKEHRALLVLRGSGLGHRVSDTDPQKDGRRPLPPEGGDGPSQLTAKIAADIVIGAERLLAGRDRANTILLRGFSGCIDIPSFPALYKFKAGAISAYPMYRGVAKLVGMEVVPCGGDFEDEIKAFTAEEKRFDFLYFHYKKTDSAGEDGNFKAKVEALEAFDARLPTLLKAGHEVVIVTGDHSTPAVWKAHSWHPVPIMMKAPFGRKDPVKRFTETDCGQGVLGVIPARSIIALALAHAGRLAKYGA